MIVVSLLASLGLLCTFTPEEEALKILMRRWQGSGGTGDWVGVLNTSYELQCDDKVYCAFLALHCEHVDSGGGPLAEGIWRTKEKRQLKWKCQSLDAKTGFVLIEGRKFDLAKGGLFVIAPKDAKLEIHQVAADLSRLPKQSVQGLVLERSKEMPPLRATLKTFGIVK